MARFLYVVPYTMEVLLGQPSPSSQSRRRRVHYVRRRAGVAVGRAGRHRVAGGRDDCDTGFALCVYARWRVACSVAVV